MDEKDKKIDKFLKTLNARAANSIKSYDLVRCFDISCKRCGGKVVDVDGSVETSVGCETCSWDQAKVVFKCTDCGFSVYFMA